MATTLVDEYRKVRKGQMASATETGQRSWAPGAAVIALHLAKTELSLREAESNDMIRFVWEYDNDYEPENSGDPVWGDRDQENERKHLADGSWEALWCRVQVPRLCPHCGSTIEDDPSRDSYWEDGTASLCGIVIDIDDRYEYKREVERELAHEAGVIS